MAFSTSAIQTTVSSPMHSSDTLTWTSPENMSAFGLPLNEKSGKHWKLRFFLGPSASAWQEVHRTKPRLPRGWARRILHSRGYVIIEGCGCDKVKAHVPETQ